MDDKRSKSYLKQKKKKAESCGESWSTKSWKDMAHYILHIDYTHTHRDREIKISHTLYWNCKFRKVSYVSHITS